MIYTFMVERADINDFNLKRKRLTNRFIMYGERLTL